MPTILVVFSIGRLNGMTGDGRLRLNVILTSSVIDLAVGRSDLGTETGSQQKDREENVLETDIERLAHETSPEIDKEPSRTIDQIGLK